MGSSTGGENLYGMTYVEFLQCLKVGILLFLLVELLSVLLLLFLDYENLWVLPLIFIMEFETQQMQKRF